MFYFKILFILSTILNAILRTHCLPVNYAIPLAIRSLQNPELYGGDMLGINITKSGNRNALPDDHKLWPMGTIPFVIDSNLAQQRDIIIKSMDQYHQNTCIRFVERTNEYDFVHISKDNGCYSYVGRTGGKQLLSLGDGCHSIGTIVHELGHAVGFFHEHQRSDRDQYIDIYWENIAHGLNVQFSKLGAQENRLLADFDFNSVMLYGPMTFSKDGRAITMTPKPQYSAQKMKEVYEKYGLSESDIKSLQKLYQCE